MPQLQHLRWQELADVLHTNVLAPLHLTQLALPHLKAVINITSDAGVEAYPGWGAYGMSKAALEHQTRTLAERIPRLPSWPWTPRYTTPRCIARLCPMPTLKACNNPRRWLQSGRRDHAGTPLGANSRLLSCSRRRDDPVSRSMRLSHSQQLEQLNFDQLPRLLQPGDLLVVNDSATLPASIQNRLHYSGQSAKTAAGLSNPASPRASAPFPCIGNHA